MRIVRVACVCLLVLLVIGISGCAGDGPAAEEPVEKPSAAVPNLVGLSESGARSVLEREGFAVGEVTSEKISESGGQPSVLSQAPAAGEMAAPGEPVDFVVSVPAVKMVEVPDIATSGTRT